jgi:peptidoglycan hydrolase-like protein with peptidoglycan-binding domain
MRGYDVGAVDGNMSPKTRQSIQEFQRAHAMPVTGELDDKTLAALDVGTAPAASGSSREAAGEHSKPAPNQTSGERYAEPKAPVDYTQQPQK